MKKQLTTVIALVIVGSNLLIGCKSVSRLIDSGGTVFVVRVEGAGADSAAFTEQAVRVIGQRIDAVGLDGEVAAVNGNNGEIEVRVYGSEDPQVLRRFLFTTHKLELKKIISPPSPSLMQMYPTRETAELTLAAGQEIMPLADYRERSPQFVVLQSAPIVTGEDIRDAQAISVTGADDNYQINFSLTQQGAAKFGDWTGRNIGSYLAVVLDGEVKSTPYIKGQILDSGQIDGRFTKASAEEIALSLRSGYFPGSLAVVSETRF